LVHDNLIQNQLKGKDDQKPLLAQRLSCLDVSGLGISPLPGDTLVNYAGSLTGRDFRHISQAAPFVIYDLVSDEVFEAWVALSKLVPLIWQPVIKDLREYTVCSSSYYQFVLLIKFFFSSGRSFSNLKFPTSFLELPAGRLAGSTNQSSISFFTWLNTYAVLVHLYYLRQRRLNHLTPLFEQKASTAIDKHLLGTLHSHLLKGTASATSLVVALF
jgi:hypothetical protein